MASAPASPALLGLASPRLPCASRPPQCASSAQNRRYVVTPLRRVGSPAAALLRRVPCGKQIANDHLPAAVPTLETHAAVDVSGKASIAAESATGTLKIGEPVVPSCEPRLLIERLWEQTGVPLWHRDYYRARYFTCHRPEVFKREAVALAEGRALVQEAMRAIFGRETCLAELARLRASHCDEEFLQTNASCRRCLLQCLFQLRHSNCLVVHAVAAWRRSVAPLPSAGGSARNAAESLASSSAVAGPGARGAIWPCPPKGEDYIWVLAHRDALVRSFEAVLHLSAVCDPLFLHMPASSSTLGAKIIVPPAHRCNTAIIEAAKLQLLEEEITLNMFASPFEGEEINGEAVPSMVAIAAAAAGATAALPFAAVPESNPEHRKLPLRPSSMDIGEPVQRLEDTYPTQSPRSGGKMTMPSLDMLVDDAIEHRAEDNRKPSFRWDETEGQLDDLGTSGRSPSKLVCIQGEIIDEATTGDVHDAAFYERLRGVFRRFAHDGTIHLDDMVPAVEASGVISPVEDWVLEVFGKVTSFSEVGYYEFIDCIDKYEEKARERLKEEFEHSDTDGSGYVDFDELIELLQAIGQAPLSHVLRETFDEVDMDGSGDLNIDEFYALMKLLNLREGCDKAEYSKYTSVYKLFDASSSDSMHTHEVQQALVYMGFIVEVNTVNRVLAEVDYDGSGTLSLLEFIGLMRRIRESELDTLRSTRRRTASSQKGCDLKRLVHSIGLFPNDLVVQETCENVGADPKSVFKDTSILWRFITNYREHEGLSRQDREELKFVYDKWAVVDEGGAAQLHANDVGNVLRFMGYWMSFEQQQLLIQHVDRGSTGRVPFDRFCKMIRICNDHDIKLARDAFQKRCALAGTKGVLTSKACEMALMEMGHVYDPDDPVLKNGGVGIDLFNFVNLVLKQIGQVRQKAKTIGGFSQDEVMHLRAVFDRHDMDGSGDIRRFEFMELLEECLPGMATDLSLRPKLVEILEHCDEDASGALDFDEFLRFFRLCQDQKHLAALEKEQKAVKETGFQPSEVQEFRELFLYSTGTAGKVAFANFCELVGGVCSLGERNIMRLNAMFRTATRNAQNEEDYEPEADFPDFLHLMRRILDCNFGNVQERTKKIVAKHLETTEPPQISIDRASKLSKKGHHAPKNRSSFLGAFEVDTSKVMKLPQRNRLARPSNVSLKPATPPFSRQASPA